MDGTDVCQGRYGSPCVTYEDIWEVCCWNGIQVRSSMYIDEFISALGRSLSD